MTSTYSIHFETLFCVRIFFFLVSRQKTRPFYHTCINFVLQSDLHIAHCLRMLYANFGLAAKDKNDQITYFHIIWSELKLICTFSLFITFVFEEKIVHAQVPRKSKDTSLNGIFYVKWKKHVCIRRNFSSMALLQKFQSFNRFVLTYMRDNLKSNTHTHKPKQKKILNEIWNKDLCMYMLTFSSNKGCVPTNCLSLLLFLSWRFIGKFFKFLWRSNRIWTSQLNVVLYISW